MKKFIFSIMLLAVLPGCSLKEESDFIRTRTFLLEYDVAPFVDENGQSVTKSAIEDGLDKINGINVLVYDSDGYLLEASSGYFSKEELAELTLPAEGVFHVHFFANVPDLTSEFPENEADIYDFGYCYTSYGQMKEMGFPMACSQYVNSSRGGVINVWFERLVTRFQISFDKSALSRIHRDGTVLKSLKICQGALDLYPFRASGSAASVCTRDSEDADKALEADIQVLNAGGVCNIYVLTNMQGTLLPEDIAQSEKTAEKLEELAEGALSDDFMEHLTYIEARCRLDCDDWSSDDVALRHYPGGLVGDEYNCSFNIYPGRSRSICLTLNDDDPLLQPWRFCAEGEVRVKKFSFSAGSLHIMKNFSRELTVTAPFDFEMIAPESHFNASLKDHTYDEANDSFIKTYQISTQEEIVGLQTPGTKAVPICEQLHFRSLTRSLRDSSISVCIYNKVFPIILKRDSECRLRAWGDNPLGLAFTGRLQTQSISDNSIISNTSSTFTPMLPKQDADDSGNVIGTLSIPAEGAVNALLHICPKWNGDCDFYMGEGNEAVFGPGPAYSPASCHPTRRVEYQRATDTSPQWAQFDTPCEFYCGISNTINNENAFPKVFFLIGADGSQASLEDSSVFSWGCPGSDFAVAGHLPFRSTGHNNCDSYDLNGFEKCPFYIANGSLQGYGLFLYTHRWNASNMMEKVRVDCYRPGRDVVGELTDNEVHITFCIEGQTHWGTTDVSVGEANYSFSGVNLIINGCSCWPGASSRSEGIRNVTLPVE